MGDPSWTSRLAPELQGYLRDRAALGQCGQIACPLVGGRPRQPLPGFRLELSCVNRCGGVAVWRLSAAQVRRLVGMLPPEEVKL